MARSRYEQLVMSTAQWLDARSWSLKSRADRALDDIYDARRARAALDPRWAAIEAKRETGTEAKIFLSDDLDFADFEEQRQIERQVYPDPWREPLYRWARTHTLAHTASEWVKRHQLARRGWSDQDVWGLGHTLAARTADMLDALADGAMSWPGNDEFPTPEDWEHTLHTQATALRAWTNPPASGTDRWHRLAITRGRQAEADAAHEQLTADEAARYKAAQEAMHWVADHLGALWD